MASSHAWGIGLAPARRLTFFHALAFVAGFAAVFIVLGASVGVVGYALRDNLVWFSRVAGILLIILGLHLTQLIAIPFLMRTYQVGNAAGRSTPPAAGGRAGPLRRYGRSLFVGGAFSVGWTPCVGPIMAGILALAADSGSVAQGTYLLVFYALGMGVPFLAIGLAMGSATALLRRVGPYLHWVEVVGGVLLVFMGMLIFLDSVTVLNQFFNFLPRSVAGAGATGGNIFGPFGFGVAFAGGLLSFFSPCMLPLVPIFLGHLAGATGDGVQSAPTPGSAHAPSPTAPSG